MRNLRSEDFLLSLTLSSDFRLKEFQPIWCRVNSYLCALGNVEMRFLNPRVLFSSLEVDTTPS